MTIIQPRHVGVFMCIWLACLAVVAQSTSTEATTFEPGVPMKTIPVHLMSRSDAGRKRTLIKFQPQDSIQLRFIEHEKAEYYGACHHVDMFVELKDASGNHTVQSLNPYAFQHAVKSISCSGSTTKLNIELSPEYTKEVRRWRVPSTKVFGIVIPHDFVDLKKNKDCYADLSASARRSTKTHPMETVVKMVKNPQFLDAKNPNIVSFNVVETNVWSDMNRAQSVKIYHKPIDEMIPRIFNKRSTAEQQGPMWDFEHSLSAATQNVDSAMPSNNVNANLDQSTVKGYAQASMAWKQTCIKNIFTGNMDCINWGITESKISGMTQVNHQAKVNVKCKSSGTATTSTNTSQPLLTLTNVNFTTPSFNLMAPIPLLGFSVPGAFDMGANIGLGGVVSVDILVQATQDLLVNTGSSTSCPWVIQWDGTLTDLPTIQFGTCSLPGTPKLVSGLGSIFRRDDSEESSFYFGPDPDSVPEGKSVSLVERTSSNSRETAFVSIGMTVAPSFSLGLSVFGFTALSAGISAPISLGVSTNWDTDSTPQCPSNNIEVSADGSASLQLNGGFFGFSKSVPIVTGPTLTSPSACVPHP
ncbi:hypothetical protein BGZ46_001166 [Entomortierella lignicola]|nr:hypothetical protein BGZ46_001166 [Entomortierella lignicola]